MPKLFWVEIFSKTPPNQGEGLPLGPSPDKQKMNGFHSSIKLTILANWWILLLNSIYWLYLQNAPIISSHELKNKYTNKGCLTLRCFWVFCFLANSDLKLKITCFPLFRCLFYIYENVQLFLTLSPLLKDSYQLK